MQYAGVVRQLVERAKKDKRKIVLPETEDVRILKAAAIISKEAICDVILIGNKDEIGRRCNEENIPIDFDIITVVNPLNDTNKDEYIKYFYEIRKEKGLTLEQSGEILKDNVYYGVMMVKMGDADGLVSGAIHTTADTLRPALQIVKAKPGLKSVSTFFLMEIPDLDFRNDGLYVFSDCGLIEFPTEDQLVDISIASAHSYRQMVGKEPKVAMLSYSTKGSAKSEYIDKIINATNRIKAINPGFDIDGELQLDAAIIEEVAKLKAPNSSVAGQANVLIFPDLEAGNIGYKLVQRFAKATALGPVTQGLAKPINDLSRGCSVEEIVGTVAITAIQSQE